MVRPYATLKSAKTINASPVSGSGAPAVNRSNVTMDKYTSVPTEKEMTSKALTVQGEFLKRPETA
ncbi:MAG: hypothetical protein ACI81R_001444 [Bradymonadia bacterium]|jgi:hypothetical protein